ncbi:probable pectinesterase 55 [Lotus japonicus]|uniref:probable pectinesterase 55 n=1 Tax=Lotus japonicus TaxID=34305 RepID=UPI00258D24EB|nr:probable pectinesterase 55 [Lotus japonicus]
MYFPWCHFTCFFLLLGFGVDLANSQTCRRVGGKILPCWTIVVDPSGHGNFTTIQSAIGSVPSNNRHWVSINVKAGIYREKLVIRDDQPYILLQGEGKTKTLVEWGDHDTTSQSPTFSTMAEYIVVKYISFINSYNNNPPQPAVAALVSGDKSYFLSVGFFGFQDTLWDNYGHHYYKSCTIQGAVDFIFGAGQSLYEDCDIRVIAGRLGPGISGYITAQGRTSLRETNGFTFKSCFINGTGTTYLGRPWKEYARVIFHNCKILNIIQPQGWDNRPYPNFYRNQLSFGEYNNYGPGSHSPQRVKWINKLSLSTVQWMSSFAFIDTVGWLNISLRIGY